ncbi:MAG: hypothetical protein ACSHXL_03540, partial [Bacteroidota bacterium]
QNKLMNNLTFILTTLSLGVMTGISGNHYFQVKSMVQEYELGKDRQGHEMKSVDLLASEQNSERFVKPVNTTFETTEPSARESELPSAQLTGSSEKTHEKALLEILTVMREEQQAMRRQLAETNRDLAEANFRLDTHSDSFKPLRVEVESARSLDSGDYEFDSSKELLPPK